MRASYRVTRHRDGSVSVKMNSEVLKDLLFELALTEAKAWANTKSIYEKYERCDDSPLNRLYWDLEPTRSKP